MTRVDRAVIVLVGALTVVRPAIAQSPEQPVRLVVHAGRSFRVALDQRVTVKRADGPFQFQQQHLFVPAHVVPRQVIEVAMPQQFSHPFESFGAKR